MKWFQSLGDTRQGILLMLLAMLILAMMDAVAKHLTGSYNPMQVVWARYACSTVVVALALAPRLRELLVTRHLGLQLIRSAFLFGATYAFFTSISRMRLADTVAIFDINPLIVTMLAFFVLKEPVGPRRWFGVIVGLIGAFIIIRPGSSMFSAYSILPLMGACSYAAYVITTRFLGRDEHILTSLLYTSLIGTIAATILVPPVWIAPTSLDGGLMITMGILGGVGQYFLIRAFTVAEAGAIAPFSYAGMIPAVSFGYVFFGEWPDLITILGALVIVISGLYVWHRENKAQSTVRTSE
ncbi:MAG: DMT family transporter [Marinosulfonomonas sp.]